MSKQRKYEQNRKTKNNKKITMASGKEGFRLRSSLADDGKMKKEALSCKGRIGSAKMQ